MRKMLPGYNSEVPTDWELKTVDQLSIRVGSGVTPRGGSEVYKNEGIIFIRSQNVTFGGLDLSDVAFIDDKTNGFMQASEVFPFDVLLNITGASIGRCCFVPDGLGRANQNQHVCTIRLPNPNLADATFLSLVLSSPIGQSQILRLNAGGNREGLNYEQLRSFDAVWPPPPERSKIAEVLSTVDRAIEQTEVLIAKQQRIKTGLMQDLLTRGIDEHGNLRSEQTHQFKDSPLGPIPVEWEVDQLRSYLSYLSYGFTNPMPTAGDGPHMVTAANISNGKIQYEGCRRTTISAYKHLLTNKSRPEAGDILITKDGTLGRLAIVDQVPLCINQSVAVLRVKDGVNNNFLKLLMESPTCQERIMADAGGSTIKHIYISKIDKMLVALPIDSSEQEAIRLRIESHSNLLYNVEQQSRKLGSLKTALMQDFLTGRRRVTALLNEEKEVV